MVEIFISYTSATVDRAKQIADALRALGYGVWRGTHLHTHNFTIGFYWPLVPD
jgi:hypothetical protein